MFGGPDTTTGGLLQSVGLSSTAVPGSLSALAMNGKILTAGRAETHPFRMPMSWRSRAPLVRAGAKVRLGRHAVPSIASPRPGEDASARQQRIYDFVNDRTSRDYTGGLPDDADALFLPTVSRSV